MRLTKCRSPSPEKVIDNVHAYTCPSCNHADLRDVRVHDALCFVHQNTVSFIINRIIMMMYPSTNVMKKNSFKYVLRLVWPFRVLIARVGKNWKLGISICMYGNVHDKPQHSASSSMAPDWATNSHVPVN